MNTEKTGEWRKKKDVSNTHERKIIIKKCTKQTRHVKLVIRSLTSMQLTSNIKFQRSNDDITKLVLEIKQAITIQSKFHLYLYYIEFDVINWNISSPSPIVRLGNVLFWAKCVARIILYRKWFTHIYRLQYLVVNALMYKNVRYTMQSSMYVSYVVEATIFFFEKKNTHTNHKNI